MRIARLVFAFALLVGSASAAPLRFHSLPATGTVVLELQKGSRVWLAASELDGSGSRALTAPPPAAGIIDDAPAISPDGTAVAFTRGAKRLNRDAALFVAPLRGGQVIRVASAAALGRGFIGTPVWSADGRLIAVGRSRSGCGRQGPRDDALYAVASDGSGVRAVSALPSRVAPTKRKPVFLNAETWAPDGRIAYFVERWPSDDCVLLSSVPSEDLYAMNPTAASRQRLAAGFAVVSWPRWSVAGDALAFEGQRRGDGHCRLYVADGSGTRALAALDTPASGCLNGGGIEDIDEGPTFAWSSSGAEIYFGRGRQILAADVASGRTRVVGTTPYPPSYCPGGCKIPALSCCEMQFESLSSDGAYLVVHAVPAEVDNGSVPLELYFLLATNGGGAWRLPSLAPSGADLVDATFRLD
jgi:Tol biopolymer transport system component